jgi:chromosome partitioning protein
LKTIAFGIQKGGVGKTSLSVSVAVELAKQKDTLLIDADPQGQASFWTVTDEFKYELSDILNGKTDLKNAVTATFQEGLYCLPTFAIGGGLKTFSEGPCLQDIGCFKSIVKAASRQGFAYCVIDLSPSFGALERAAYIAADEVITPIMPDPLCVDSLAMFTYNLADLKKKMDALDISVAAYHRLVLNAINNSYKFHTETVAAVKEKMKQQLYFVPVDQAFKRAADNHVGLDKADARKETLTEIKRLCADIMEERNAA